MSKTLGMDVVAEGVETHMQREMLKQFGCHIFQGYLWAARRTGAVWGGDDV